MTDTRLGPIGRGARIESLDVLRGVAALGILLMNIPAMGLRWEWARPPLPATLSLDWIAFSIQNVGAQGTMRGLFTLLFGAGMIVMLSRPDPTREAAAVQAYLTRCFALLLLGVANFAIFLWPGEILFNYGLVGLILLLFRKVDTRVLVVAAATALIVMTVSMSGQATERANGLRLAEAAVVAKAAGKKPTEEQAKALEKREEMVKKITSPEARAKERAERTAFPSIVAWSAKQWTDYNLSGDGAIGLLESLGFMLIGMILFRIGVLTGERTTGFYGALTFCGLALGLLLRGGVEALRWRAGFLPNADVVIASTLLYEAGRLAMTLGVLGFTMMLLKQNVLAALGRGLAAVGRMALTTYIGQSIITSILFYGLGFYDRFGFAQLMGVAALIWVAQITLSVLWLKRFEMGPAEWVLRSVTYGSWRSMKKPEAWPQSARGAQAVQEGS